MISFLLLTCNAVAINSDLIDYFPDMDQQYDLTIRISDRGPHFLHVQSYFNDDFPDASFQLYHKEYSENNHLIRFNKTTIQTESDFHFLVDYGHTYEFCVVAIDNQTILGATRIQRVIPSNILTVQPQVYPQTSDSVTQSRVRNNSNQGLFLTLDISQQSFPFINLTSQILFDGTHFDKLTLSNFHLKEDNRIQTIKRIIPPSTSENVRIVDIVFVIDDSGSMGDEADAVKETVSDFAEKFEQNNVDYRIALLPYGGSDFSKPEGIILNNGFMHDNVNDFKNDVNKMKFSGGTECAYKAMDKAIHEYHWRPNTQKVLLLITDEPNDSSCGYFKDDILKVLSNELNLIVYIICLSTENSYDALNTHSVKVKIKKELDSQKGLEDAFTDIFEEINSDIINQYILQYETDNQTIDGNCRTVELTVNIDLPTQGDFEKSASKQYCPNKILTLMLTPETKQLSNEPQRKNAPLTIEALLKQTSNSDTDISSYSLVLNYANCSSSEYSNTVMSRNASDPQLFQTTIRPEYVLPECVKYYIEASGDLGKFTYPADHPAYTPVVISVMPNSSPVIVHQPTTKAFQNTPIRVQAEIEDVTHHIKSVTLFYRKKGDFLYQSVTTTTTQTQMLFEQTIPELFVTPIGVQYYIVATDNHGSSSAIGTPENPLDIFVTNPDTPHLPTRNIGNVVIYADEFIQDKTDEYITSASGQVMIGTISGNGPLIRTNTTLILHFDKRRVNSLSSGNITAINIKRDIQHHPEDIPLYSGTFEIDCISNPPVLHLNNGISTLKLVQGIPFYFSSQNPGISLGTDDITLRDLTLPLSKGFNSVLSMGNIVLSQSGNTTHFCTATGALYNACTYDRSKSLSISDIQFDFNLLEQSFKGTGELAVSNVIGFQDKGISANFECQQDPFSIIGISGEIKYLDNPNEDVIIPSAYDQTVHIIISNGLYHLDLKEQLPVITGYGEILFDDAQGIISTVNQLTQHEFLHGSMAFSIDLSGKTHFLGEMWLFDHIRLKNGSLIAGTPHEISADIDIQEKLLEGHIHLSVWQSNNQIEITGLNPMNWNIPLDSPWIGGHSIQKQMVHSLIRLSPMGVEKAGFESNYHLFFMPFSICLDITPGVDSTIEINGWKDITHSHPITQHNNQITFTINNNYNQLAIVATSDLLTTDFDIHLPEAGSYSPSDIAPFMGNDSEFSMAIDDIFFMKNNYIHESYYAINSPPKGGYTLNIKNSDQIGNTQIKLFVPDDTPTMQLLQPSNDIIAESGQSIPIQWKAENIHNDARISLYIDKDTSGANGILIYTNLVQHTHSNTYQWTVTDDIPSGTWYVYASLSDNQHAPVLAFTTARITIIKENSPAAPEYVVAVAQEWGTEIRWNSVSTSEILGYRVHVTEPGENNPIVYDIGVGTDAECAFMGLKQNQSYEIAVSVVDLYGNESNRSQSVDFVSSTEGDGGNPDLTLDNTASSLTGEAQRLTVSAVIKNIGNNAAYSAMISCYYGPVSPDNFVEAQMMSQLPAGQNYTFTFNIHENSDHAKRTGGQDVYITIGDVKLQEINTKNNVGTISNNTLFSAQNGMLFQSSNGYVLEVIAPLGYTITELTAIPEESIPNTQTKPDNFSYDLIEMIFETPDTADVGIIFPKALPNDFNLYSYTSHNGWHTLPFTANASQKTVTITFTDGAACDADNRNQFVQSIFGLAPLPVIHHETQAKSEDSSSCFISILENY